MVRIICVPVSTIQQTGNFTQPDPMPYGAGSSFEGAYVYAGARPTVMTDPGGKRFGPGGYLNMNAIRSFGDVEFDQPVAEDSDPNSEASCEARYRSKVVQMDDLSAGWAVLWKTASGSCKKLIRSVANFRDFNNRLGLAIAPDYFMFQLQACVAANCHVAVGYLSRYNQIFLGSEKPFNFGSSPKHAFRWQVAPEAAVRAGWFDRQIDPSNSEQDSRYLDAKLDGANGAVGGSVPTPYGVNVSVQMSNTSLGMKGAGFEIGVATPGPPSAGVSGGMSLWKVPGRGVRQLW
jgi:hypothetical protein